MATITGGCHCGALALELATERPPAELPVRLCGCTFCAKHRPRYTSDPTGSVSITAREAASLVRYRFGLALADFLICGRCGVFVAAFEPGEPGRAVINSAVLAGVELTAPPTTFDAYDTEDAATRSARRARAWTPATLVLMGA